ncbi:hypothetical protein ACWM0J_09865 [Pediococcus acidilactici]
MIAFGLLVATIQNGKKK